MCSFPLGFEGFDEEATFTLSMRGQFKLVHGGFGYNKMCASISSGITTWRCALNQSYPHLKCRAKCYTRQFGVLQKVKQIGEHTHAKTIAPRLPARKMNPQSNGKKKIKPKSKAKPRKKVPGSKAIKQKPKPKPKPQVVELNNVQEAQLLNIDFGQNLLIERNQ